MLPIGTSTTRGWPEQLDVGGDFLRQPEGRHCTKGQWIMFCDALPVGNVEVFKFRPVNDNVLALVVADSKAAILIHAHGTFSVTLRPLSPAPAEGLARYGMEKQLHGDIEGTSKGEMSSGGDPAQSAAGYVAIEVVTGTVKGTTMTWRTPLRSGSNGHDQGHLPLRQRFS